MSDIWFTSDTHFCHKKILEFCPERAARWSNVDEMNVGLIQRWNAHVKPTDTVYHVGDVSFGKAGETIGMLSRLHGTKHLIAGNHDQVVLNNPDVAACFASIDQYKTLRVEKLFISLFHFPIASPERVHRGGLHFHGHTHGNYQADSQRIDVGIDSPFILPEIPHRPFHLDEILQALKKLPAYKVVDQHGKGDK